MKIDIFKVFIAVALLTAFVVLTWAGRAKTGSLKKAAIDRPELPRAPTGPWVDFKRPSYDALRETLDPLQFSVTQEDGTERAFNNRYWNNHRDGLYVDIVSGEPLFCSIDKYESGSGWPSFTRPVVDGYVTEHEDNKLGMRRIEVRSRIADSHLGHVFPDGPEPTGLRYCINSAALRFIPVAHLEEEGYGDFLALFDSEEKESMNNEKTEVAVLAGGCFWGMEEIIRAIDGVVDTDVGYTGGTVKNATYQDVRSGMSGHAESIRVIFDPDKISYEEILGYFFRMHDPTTLNRQGNDRGSQYRSAIFYTDERQHEIAMRVKEEVDKSGKWNDPIVTEIVEAGPFYSAEEYHQDYLVKHPGGYTCHFLRD